MDRIQFQVVLENLLGSRNVYFQPPESVKMSYPAIIYSRQNIENGHANNGVYTQDWSYQVTVVDKNPDSEIVKKVAMLPKCRFDRHYKADNLNHDVFSIYI